MRPGPPLPALVGHDDELRSFEPGTSEPDASEHLPIPKCKVDLNSSGPRTRAADPNVWPVAHSVAPPREPIRFWTLLRRLRPPGEASPEEPLPPGGDAYQNPVATLSATDPSVVRAPVGTFYLCATQDDWADGDGRHCMPLFRSDDLVDRVAWAERWPVVEDGKGPTSTVHPIPVVDSP